MEKGIYLPDIAVYISYKRNHLTCDYYTEFYTKNICLYIDFALWHTSCTKIGSQPIPIPVRLIHFGDIWKFGYVL